MMPSVSTGLVLVSSFFLEPDINEEYWLVWFLVSPDLALG
jgi:hypothetical protein